MKLAEGTIRWSGWRGAGLGSLDPMSQGLNQIVRVNWLGRKVIETCHLEIAPDMKQ